jgi:hypothetical protein
VAAADLARGKAQAKRATLASYEVRGAVVEDLARQATGTGKVRSLQETLAALDRVTAADIMRVRTTPPARVDIDGETESTCVCVGAVPMTVGAKWPVAVVQVATAALKSKPTAVAYGDVHEAPLSVGLGL